MTVLHDPLPTLSEHMADIAVSMDYYGGLAPWARHARDLMGAAGICQEWADEIEKEPA